MHSEKTKVSRENSQQATKNLQKKYLQEKF